MTFLKYGPNDFYNEVLQALHALGGSGTIKEIDNKVANIKQLTEEQINELHRGSVTKLSYRLRWTRNHLRNFGLLEISKRGVWALTAEGLKTTTVDKKVVKDFLNDLKEGKVKSKGDSGDADEVDGDIQEITWQEELIEHLIKMPADSFERLCQRLLRELGFANVEVTGKSDDKGIDGKGILKIGKVLSFPVVFQAKRYAGTVGPGIVRDFRGAMAGRADKGLIITTGTFTTKAEWEATRDGVAQIDLIDGTELSEHLKKLGLGIDVQMVEKVSIKKEWFNEI